MSQTLLHILALVGVFILAIVANAVCSWQYNRDKERERKQMEEDMRKATELASAALESKTEPKINELIN